jgi:primosomal protein N'
MRDRVNVVVGRKSLKIILRGPMPATISRVQRFHRMQILVQAPDSGTMHTLFAALRGQPALKPAVKVAIDIDPVNLL